MDVFMINYPHQLISALADADVDVVVSAHQYSPREPNIGVFGARSEHPSVAQAFRNTIEWTERDRKIHDQRAFCLVMRLCVNKEFRQSPINVLLPSGARLNVRLLGYVAQSKQGSIPCTRAFGVCVCKHMCVRIHVTLGHAPARVRTHTSACSCAHETQVA